MTTAPISANPGQAPSAPPTPPALQAPPVAGFWRRCHGVLENNLGIKIAVRLGQTLGWLSLFVGVSAFGYTYVKDRRSSVEQAQFQAWTLIATQSGKMGNGGQIAALGSLVRDHVPIRGIAFVWSYLDGVNLRHAAADNASFEHASMQEANLSFGSFLNADFTGADLSGAVMIAFNNPYIDVSQVSAAARPRSDDGAKLISRNSETLEDPRNEERQFLIKTARPYGVKVDGASFMSAKLMDADLRLALLDHAKLDSALLYRAKLARADLTGASLRARLEMVGWGANL